MTIEITPQVEGRLKKEDVIWLTTVREDGQPLPTPVWFLWQDGAFLIFSQPAAQKLRNIEHDPRIALNLNSDQWGGEVAIFTGKARIGTEAPAVQQAQAYIEKYRQGISDIGMTPESFRDSYSVAIQIIPERYRSW